MKQEVGNAIPIGDKVTIRNDVENFGDDAGVEKTISGHVDWRVSVNSKVEQGYKLEGEEGIYLLQDFERINGVGIEYFMENLKREANVEGWNEVYEEYKKVYPHSNSFKLFKSFLRMRYKVPEKNELWKKSK